MELWLPDLQQRQPSPISAPIQAPIESSSFFRFCSVTCLGRLSRPTRIAVIGLVAVASGKGTHGTASGRLLPLACDLRALSRELPALVADWDWDRIGHTRGPQWIHGWRERAAHSCEGAVPRSVRRTVRR